NPYATTDSGWVPEHIEIANRSTYSGLCVFMSFVFVLAVPLNLLVIVATYKNKDLRRPINYIIVNLAVADLTCSVVGGLLGVLNNGAGYYFLGKSVCIFEGYVMSVTGVCGILSITVMAFERYFVVCKPFGQTNLKWSHAITGIVFTWTWSVIWHTPGLFFWNGYEPEGFGTSCAPNWFSQQKSERIFIFAYFAFCFLTPLTIIFACYLKLILFIRKVSKKSMVNEADRRDFEVTRMVFVMIAAFLICWLPYGCLSMYNAIHPDNLLSYGIGSVPAFFAKTATIYNPIIYMGLNKKFRDGVIRMLFKGRNPWLDGRNTTSSTSTRAQGSLINREVDI
uniref:G-protein coupled receptors family 1 profile domain-containing protein n=1 Tax=Ciona savignyi TaxID=51511 RepID=H2Z431_CIOSA